MIIPRRVSLFYAIVCFPVIVACVLGFLRYKQRENQRRVLAVFIDEVTNGRKVFPQALVEAFGPKEAARLISENTRNHPTIAFDGHDRFMQVLPVPLPSGQGMGDGYTLYSVLNGGPLREWTLERGAIITDAVLTSDGVRFSIAGDIRYHNNPYQIPISQPEIFDLKWPQVIWPPTPQNSLYRMMYDRHVHSRRKSANP